MSVIRSEQSQQYEEPEDRVDAFVFVREVEPPKSLREVIGQLRVDFGEHDEGPIVFLSETIGEFRAVIHLSAPTLGDIQDFIGDELWEAGVHSEHAVEESVLTTTGNNFRPMGPIRHSPKPPHLALLRITLIPNVDPHDLVAAIGELISGISDELLFFASTVYGKFDMLVELGADADQLKPMLMSVRAIRAFAQDREEVEELTTAIGYIQREG